MQAAMRGANAAVVGLLGAALCDPGLDQRHCHPLQLRAGPDGLRAADRLKDSALVRGDEFEPISPHPLTNPPYIYQAGYMESLTAIPALAALAQTTRLDTFRLLVRHEPEGLAAGELARLLEIPQNTMSAHLATLSRAGLVAGERQSRSIIYRAKLDQLRDLMLFLVKDCCGGSAELRSPLVAELMPCCAPEEARQ